MASPESTPKASGRCVLFCLLRFNLVVVVVVGVVVVVFRPHDSILGKYPKGVGQVRILFALF